MQESQIFFYKFIFHLFFFFLRFVYLSNELNTKTVQNINVTKLVSPLISYTAYDTS